MRSFPTRLAPTLPAILFLLWACLISACGGPGNVGEACERPGDVVDCVDGAICAQDQGSPTDPTDPVWDTYTCRSICVTQADCDTGTECRGVTGAPAGQRACQPFRDTTP